MPRTACTGTACQRAQPLLKFQKPGSRHTARSYVRQQPCSQYTPWSSNGPGEDSFKVQNVGSNPIHGTYAMTAQPIPPQENGSVRYSIFEAA